jgi:hypothetical protein
MSREVCNRVLAGTAIATLAMTIFLVLFIQQASGPGAILQILGKWLLLWAACPVVVGIAAEVALGVAGRIGKRGAAGAPLTEQLNRKVPQV